MPALLSASALSGSPESATRAFPKGTETTSAAESRREVIEKALILYYSLREPDVPKWAKATIVAALGYFIFPADAIPDITPVVGYADDLGVLVAALAAVAAHVTPEAKRLAGEQIKILFGE